MVSVSRTIRGRPRDERGFSLIELMIVAAITSAVLGAAVAMTSDVDKVYTYQLDDATVQQEARFAMDWITRILSAAGSNPYDITVSDCPAAGTTFEALRLDPDGDGIHDDVRVQADVNPPNMLLLGTLGNCTEPDEDVTIAHDPVSLTVTRRDRAIDATPVPVTSGVFTQLRFTYLTTNRLVTANPDAVAFVQVDLTGQSASVNKTTGQATTFTYESEVRLRAR